MSGRPGETPGPTLRIAFCWAEASGYMASCWSALAATGVEVFLIAAHPAGGSNTSFDPGIVAGVHHEFFTRQQLATTCDAALGAVRRWKPDVVVISGWTFAAYVEIAHQCRREHVPVIMAMDNPKRSSTRAALRRARSWRFFQSIDAIAVPGERGRQQAVGLGFANDRIFMGLYGVDHARLGQALEQRLRAAWPKRFLFVGQLTETKGFDRLLQGYVRYRESSPDAWSLTVCGLGPMADAAARTDGVDYLGFVGPDEVARLMAEHGAFVIVSRFDPWPLALVEASSAGLPIVCTSACGSSVELVRDRHNGRIIGSPNVDAIADALRWVASGYVDLAAMGRRSRELASAYSAERWADRWMAMAHDVMGKPTRDKSRFQKVEKPTGLG